MHCFFSNQLVYDVRSVPFTSPVPLQCAANEWQCKNGDCIDKALRCNRVYDCVDGTDEFDCGRSPLVILVSNLYIFNIDELTAAKL